MLKVYTLGKAVIVTVETVVIQLGTVKLSRWRHWLNFIKTNGAPPRAAKSALQRSRLYWQLHCYRTPRFNTPSQPNQQTLNTSLPNSKLSLFTSLVVSRKTKQHGALVITQCVPCMRKVCRACVRRVCMTFLHTPPPDNKSRMKKKTKWGKWQREITDEKDKGRRDAILDWYGRSPELSSCFGWECPSIARSTSPVWERGESGSSTTSTTFGVGAFGLPVDDVITGIAERLTVFNAVAIFRLVVDEAINVEATASCLVSSEESTLSAGCCGFGKTQADFPFSCLSSVMTSGLVSDPTGVCFNSGMCSCPPIDDGLLTGIGRSGLCPNMTEHKQPFSYRRLIPPTAAISSSPRTTSVRTVDRSATTMNLELVAGKLTAPSVRSTFNSTMPHTSKGVPSIAKIVAVVGETWAPMLATSCCEIRLRDEQVSTAATTRVGRPTLQMFT